MATFACVHPNIGNPFIPPSCSSTANCLQQLSNDSDCGSSSGIGGMKTQEASDECASSSSSHAAPFNRPSPVPPPQPPPSAPPLSYAVVPAPAPPPAPASVAAPATASSTTSNQTSMYNSNVQPPTSAAQQQTIAQQNLHASLDWFSQAVPGGENDLFVHVQQGETLSVWVHGELQHVHGPATIRMVGEPGVVITNIPLNVPPGHICHQILDELGILRHIILSRDSSTLRGHNSRELVAHPTLNIPLQGQVTAFTPPHYFNNNRKWIPHQKQLPVTTEEEVEVDPEENERLREMLNRIISPQVVRVTTNEVDIQWQPLDTSEANSPGGPFPQIDASEFTYHAAIYENTGRFIANYICDVNAGNIVRVGNLRPNTDYSVQMKASLDERGISGEPSPHFFFRTAPGRPEAPLMPRVVGKGQDFVHLIWRPSIDNGAPVTGYLVYVHPIAEEAQIIAFQFLSTEGKIVGLKPATVYRFRITSTNALGESFDSAIIDVDTKPDTPPVAPPAPAVTSVTHRAVRLTWIPIPECNYAIEMFDVAKKTTNIVRDRLTGTSIQIGDLNANSEYHFRMFARSAEGETPRSDWTIVRTQQARSYINNMAQPPPPLIPTPNTMTSPPPPIRSHPPPQIPVQPPQLDMPPRVPATPTFIRYVNKKTEVGWKCYGAKERETQYHLEGSSMNHPHKFRTLYRGPGSTYLVTDDDVQFIRVQSISKRGLTSDFSETFAVPRLDEELAVQKPEKLEPPVLTPLPRGNIRVHWKPITSQLRPKCVVSYFLQRLDGPDGPEPVYNGPDTEDLIENVPSESKVTVRVRASIVSNEFTIAGDWSESATITSARGQPLPPFNARFIEETNTLTWDCKDNSKDLKFRVDVMLNRDAKTLSSHETTEKMLEISKLSPGTSYTFSVISTHGGGESDESATADFVAPARIPTQPEAISILSSSPDQLTVRWTAADDRGSPIISYRLKLYQGTMFISETAIAANNESNGEYSVTQLEPNTHYKVEMCAENSIGEGPSVSINGRTKPMPPVPPKLECEPEATAMRIRWKNTTPQVAMTYKLVRLSKNDQHVTVYEGENMTSKVKNLTQDTEYTFQIKACNKITGASVWSEAVTFRTSLAPPPMVRNGPTATASPTKKGYHNIEWANVLTPNSSSNQQFYRLQAVESNDSQARWHTVYEGAEPSFSLKTSQYKGPIHIRVFCVRFDAEGEVKSQASPVTFVMNDVAETHEPEKTTIETTSNGYLPWHRRIHKNVFHLFVVIFFLIFAIVLTRICEWLFNLSSGSELPVVPPAPPVAPAYTPTPPMMPSKIVHPPAHREL